MAAEPDGLLHFRPDSIHQVGVVKIGPWIELRFLDSRAETESRLDLRDPIAPVDAYTQLMMLSLLWNPRPSLIHVMGLGGGIVPMSFYRYARDVTIECTEVNSDVIEVAEKFFGVVRNARLRVISADSREYLESAGRGTYDMIFVDAFEGLGYSAYPFVTWDFFRLCKDRLTPDGLVCVNLLSSDPLYFDRIRTLMVCFENLYVGKAGPRIEMLENGTPYIIPSGQVFFGFDGKALSKPELELRAREITEKHPFTFPFAKHTAKLRPIAEIGEYVEALAGAKVLYDG
jgi:hypothetical protein